MKNLKVVFIVVALGAAVTITLVYGLGKQSIPDTDEAKSWWMCGECGHSFQMTQAEEAEARERGPKPWPPAICPSCKQQAAYRALICDECGFPYLGPGVPGGHDKCPRCYPDAKPYEEVEEEEYDDTGGRRRPVHAI